MDKLKTLNQTIVLVDALKSLLLELKKELTAPPPAPVPEFKVGMIVRYNGEICDGDEPPKAGAIGTIITIDLEPEEGETNVIEVLFPPVTCDPNPYWVKTTSIEIVDRAEFKKPELKVGMFVRVTWHTSRDAPQIGSVGIVKAIDGAIVTVLFPPETCEPNPFKLSKDNLTSVNTPNLQ